MAAAGGVNRELARWPVPLRLLVSLLGPAPGRARGLDRAGWDEFARLVIDRHRVAPPVLPVLERDASAVPADVLERIRAEARANAFAALAQKAETRRVLLALAERGCRPMLLKGWPLAEELAGSAAARHSKDIDLYIDAGERGLCYEVLRDLGYTVADHHRGRLPILGKAALASECNDLELRHASGNQVEIHWRSNHFRGWPDLRATCGEAREWALDETGVRVRVPTPAENLTYLALHGQQHAWLRLKWLHDIALFMRRSGGSAHEGVLEAARSAGAERAVISAVHLAHTVFGEPLPRGWPEPDRLARLTLAWLMRGIAADRAPGSRRARFDFYWIALLMAEGAAQRLGVLRYAFWRGPRLFIAGWRGGARDGGPKPRRRGA